MFATPEEVQEILAKQRSLPPRTEEQMNRQADEMRKEQMKRPSARRPAVSQSGTTAERNLE